MRTGLRAWVADTLWRLARWKWTLRVCASYPRHLNRVTEVAEELYDAGKGKKQLGTADFRRLADRLLIE